jgi:hypothetical protein
VRTAATVAPGSRHFTTHPRRTSRRAVSPLAHTAGTDARACAIAPATMVGAALGLPVGRVVGTVEGPVAFLNDLRAELSTAGYRSRIQTVPYRFQKNADQMLVIKAR